MWRTAIFPLALLAAACSVRRPVDAWRLVRNRDGVVLVPPGRIDPATRRRTLTPGIPAGTGPCDSSAAIAIRRRGRRIRVTIRTAALAQQPAGWLKRWASQAESSGCVAPGTASDLAERIVESVPLDPATAWRLVNKRDIRAGFGDLEPGYRLQVDSPIFREGAPPGAAAVETTATGGTGESVNLDVKASPDLLGFERAWYTLSPRKTGGATIVPLGAERHIGGRIEARAVPSADYFRFPRDAAFYRLFYRADRTIVVVAAADYSALERIAAEVDTDPSRCGTPSGPACVVIPSQVGVNPEILVRVQGEERALPVGSTVAVAIRAAGGSPPAVLPRLKVERTFAGRLAPVRFDPAANDILSLRLSGGETLAW